MKLFWSKLFGWLSGACCGVALYAWIFERHGLPFLFGIGMVFAFIADMNSKGFK